MENWSIYLDTDTVLNFGTQETRAKDRFNEDTHLMLVCQVGSGYLIAQSRVFEGIVWMNETEFNQLLSSL